MNANDEQEQSAGPEVRRQASRSPLSTGALPSVAVVPELLYLARPKLTYRRLTAWATPRAFEAARAIDARGVAHAVKLIFRNLDFFICRGWRILRSVFRLRG